MKVKTNILQAPATPAQVLGIFLDRQRLEHGRSLEAGELLSFETTVDTWLDAADFLDWWSVSKALNKYFEVEFSKSEWRGVMKPENKKTLRDVRALIASRATFPKPGEVTIMGASCRTAAAFLALRSHLHQAGVNVRNLRPSTKLPDFLRLHHGIMLDILPKFIPGRLPRVAWKSNIAHRLAGWSCLVCLIALVFSELFGLNLLTAASCLALMFAFILVAVFSNLPPAKVHFEGFETFGDLSRLIAGEGSMESKNP